MKYLLFTLLSFAIQANAQDSVAPYSNASALPLCRQLIQGDWINTKDAHNTFHFTKDSLIEQTPGNPSSKKDTLFTLNYSYTISALTLNDNPPQFSNPNLFKNWYGLYIYGAMVIRGLTYDRNMLIYSVSKNYLRIGKNGEITYVRKK